MSRAKPIPVDLPEELKARFWAKVDVRGPEECWEWQGFRMKSGYGRYKIAGILFLAHRLAKSWQIGRSLISGEMACHHCDNRACVNPSHLFVGSAMDNSRDAVAKGRTHKWRGLRSGADNPRAKVTLEQARAIRCDPRPKREISRDYGIARHTIMDIQQGRTWK